MTALLSMPAISSKKTTRADGAPKQAIDWAAVYARLEQAGAALPGRSASAATEKEILVRRARALAVPPRADAAPTDELAVVAFALGSQVFGLEAAFVQEAVLPRDLTGLPGVPAFVRGLVNVRSRVVAAFDLKPLLHLPASAEALDEKLLIVAFDGVEFGVLADRVLGLRGVAPARLRPNVPGLNNKYLRGLADDGLILLDLAALFADLALDEANES